MYFHVQRLINDIVPDEPDPAAANALQEGLGGQFGEMRTMMQYLFQSMNFRGPKAKPFRDLIQGIGTEEISHVELIGTTISRLLDGSPRYNGKLTDPLDTPGAKGATPLTNALHESNIHHYLVASQGALPVDAAGNPWSGSYVYNSGNLVLDLLYNLMLEATGRLQKCRIYEMTDNKTARSTIAYLIVRDQAHENGYAKALEALGVQWNTILPIPKTNAERFPEVKKLTDLGLHSKQYTFDLAAQSEAGRIYQGMSPSNDGTNLDASEQAPEGVPSVIAEERFEEYSPGLDKNLLALIQAAADIEMAEVTTPSGHSRRRPDARPVGTGRPVVHAIQRRQRVDHPCQHPALRIAVLVARADDSTMSPIPSSESGQAIRPGIVVGTTENDCTVVVDGRPVEAPYASFFPTPRLERVAPGHLVALLTAADHSELVVWRWFDAVVQGRANGGVRLWEPSHGSVIAQPRSADHDHRPGSRAYLSAGLPGVDWWVAGSVVDRAEDADVELAEVGSFLAELGLL